MNAKKHDRKQSTQRRNLLIACAAGALVLVALLITAGVMTFQDANRVYPLVRAEAGLLQLDPDVFLRDRSQRAAYEVGPSQAQLAVPGVYEVVIRCGGRSYPSRVEVVDTASPVAVAVPVTSNGELPAPEAFIGSVLDATAVTVVYKTVPDVTQEGQQTVTLILTDAAGNVSELTSTLTVVPDTEPTQAEPWLDW